MENSPWSMVVVVVCDTSPFFFAIRIVLGLGESGIKIGIVIVMVRLLHSLFTSSPRDNSAS
jgi:hypothetical protein